MNTARTTKHNNPIRPDASSNRLARRAAKRAYTEAEAAEYIGMSRSFLRQARMNGQLKNRTPAPRYVRIFRSIRYLVDDLDAWLEEFRVDQGGQQS
jgi:hypothetical protein